VFHITFLLKVSGGSARVNAMNGASLYAKPGPHWATRARHCWLRRWRRDEPGEKPAETAGFAAEHVTTVSAAAAIHHDIRRSDQIVIFSFPQRVL
jgi:hypothetical protein